MIPAPVTTADPAAQAQGAGRAVDGLGQGYRETRRRRSRWWATAAFIVLAAIIISAVFASLIAPYTPNAIDPGNILAGPSAAHPFGTDELGRDLLTRVLYGGRISLAIGFLGTVVAMLLGAVWGALASLGTWVDRVIMRLADAIMAIPVLLLALMLTSVAGSSESALVLILGLVAAPLVARVARITFRAELELDYCLAARAAGAGNVRLLFREVAPNAAPVLITEAVVIAGSVIGLEATLSFLGLGIQPPAASWGTLIQGGYANLYSSVTYILFPGLMIVATIWTLNILADSLQERLAVEGRQRLQRVRWAGALRRPGAAEETT